MKRVYAIRDVKAEAYGPLMAFGHDAVAVRSFDDLLRSEGTMPAKHPEDFELVELGTFYDDHDPEHAALPLFGIRPRVVMTGVSWKAMQASGPELAREA